MKTKVNLPKHVTDHFDAMKGMFRIFASNQACGNTTGYNSLPEALERAMEVGVENIFFMSEDSHSYVDDDYSTFTYWDNARCEVFSCGWTTAAACPSYGLYKLPIRAIEARSLGLMDMEGYLGYLKNVSMKRIHGKSDIDPQMVEGTDIKVRVSRGRKWKGEGYLLSINKRSYQFAAPQFSRHSADFGISTSYTAVIYDPVKNEINECNADYLEIVGVQQVMDGYREWAGKVVDGMKVENINDRFSFDTDFSTDTWLEMKRKQSTVDTSTATYPANMERMRKQEEFKAKKIQELVEWVTKNTEKKGDDIMKLAEHIYNKRYA